MQQTVPSTVMRRQKSPFSRRVRRQYQRFAASALIITELLSFGLVRVPHVSAILSAVGPISADNGYPMWYRDSTTWRLSCVWIRLVACAC